MRLWLVTIGEPVPLGNHDGQRLLRTGYTAQLASEQGHQVTWWTSAFDHFQKKPLFPRNTAYKLNDRLEIRLLHGGGYGSNLSVKRILDHQRVARTFSKMAPHLPRPDVIVCAFPTIGLSLASVGYGRAKGVPVVVDLRDMWPDIFSEVLPKSLRWFGALIMWSLYRNAQKACRGATAITGITDAFVEWGLQKAGRLRTEKDRCFPMGYVAKKPEPNKIGAAEMFWDERGIRKKGSEFVACFIGTIGRQLDLETVIRVAHKLCCNGSSIKFVICGSGDRSDQIRLSAEGCPNVVFPGWVDAAQIYVLMRRSAVGLDPLPDRFDFLATINNKAIEYMSAGLPVISSPEHGVLADLLRRNRCGLSYPWRNARGLTELLTELYDNRDKVRDMGRNASDLFNKKFQAEKVYAEMMKYLVELSEIFKK